MSVGPIDPLIASLAAQVDRDLMGKYGRGTVAAWDRAVSAYRRLCATPWGTHGHFPAMAIYDAAINALPASFETPFEVAQGSGRWR